MDLLHGEGDRFVVVDVETTGVYDMDRVVEVAAITVSPHGQIVDEWDTLVNPGRDVGPTHIHKISASMISAAPTFAEVAAALAERLHGAVVVAHNLSFDTRMLVNEYRRHDGQLRPGSGICTLRLFGSKLEAACRHRGIPFEYPHRALADARATARLLRSEALSPIGSGVQPASVALTEARFSPRTLRRDLSAEPDDQMPYLARLADRTHHYGVHESALVYMDLLDWALCDLEISRAEAAQLQELAIDIGLSASEVEAIHRRYLNELIEAALRDGVVQDHEMTVLDAVGSALGLGDIYADNHLDGRTQSHGQTKLSKGMTVCFTGAATREDGSALPRALLNQIASDLDLEVVDRFTKSCDLLVAADPSTQSGKARKARSWGMPVVSVDAFLLAQPDSTIPTS